MLTGISTACFYPELLENALRRVADSGAEATEVFINCGQELNRAYLTELRRVADSGGVKILAVHPYECPMDTLYFFSRYNRRFSEGLEVYRRYFEAANILGAEFVVFHGGARKLNIPIEFYCERFGLLLEDAERYGSRVCHENVERCAGHSPEFFVRMSDLLPRAGYVLDLKQSLRAGVDPFTMAKAMSRGLKHVHFSDSNSTSDCLPPGKGSFNTGEFLLDIAKNGFEGGVVVELYRENYGDYVELYKSYQLLLTEVSTLRNNAEKSGTSSAAYK